MGYSHLFNEGKFGGLTVKNRVVMPPMVRNYANADGTVTDRYVAHIERVARGGVGTIILEASYVSPEGKGFVNELGVHDDIVIPGLKKLVEAAHRHGAAIGVQLYHAGRQTSSKTTGQQPIAPSPLPDPTVNEIPRQMSRTEIDEAVRKYGEAARRAKAAGCDFVEIHGAHGYLITQFLSPYSNRRTDAYGGTPEKRMRFLLEVAAAVRTTVGEGFPVLVRLSGDEMVEGGITVADTVKIAKRLEAEGIDGLHISAGNYASYARGKMIPPMAVPDGPLVDAARAVKRAVGIPVIAVAKIRSPKMADDIIADGLADFVAVGRTLLADPEWPNKAREGRVDDIMPCIACNQGCISRLFAQQDVWCTVNPETGREREFAVPAKTKKKVLVIGGGPGGMMAAITAKKRGHDVVLFEKSAKLGGQLAAAAAAPHREGWQELRTALVRQIKQLGVTVFLKREFSLADLSDIRPDAAIVATGSAVTVPKIPGIGRTQVVTSRDLLERKKKTQGRNVVVAGGGCAGAQTAEALASDGHKVIIVEAGAQVATDAPVDDRALLLGRLEKLGVAIRTETSLMSIGERAVRVESPSGMKTLAADTVVLCLGSYPNDGITAELKERVKQVAVIGDALQARRVTEAVEEGALAALSL